MKNKKKNSYRKEGFKQMKPSEDDARDANFKQLFQIKDHAKQYYS